MKIIWIAILTLLLNPLEFALAASGSAAAYTQCNVANCPAGSKVLSYAKKDDPFYACPTQQLGTYANYVIGMVSAIYSMTGQMPNISPVTGDPEQTGQSKILLDALRKEASVKTFDQAVAMCKSGKNRVRLTVMNFPDQGQQMWVGDEKTKESFWMPKSHANLIK